MYDVRLSKKALKDKENLNSAGLSKKAKILIDVVKENPYKTPPTYEKLVGDLKGLYSRRINSKHRMVYSVDETLEIVIVLSLWTHYEF